MKVYSMQICNMNSWFDPRTDLEPLMARVFEKISRASEPSLQIYVNTNCWDHSATKEMQPLF